MIPCTICGVRVADTRSTSGAALCTRCLEAHQHSDWVEAEPVTPVWDEGHPRGPDDCDYDDGGTPETDSQIRVLTCGPPRREFQEHFEQDTADTQCGSCNRRVTLDANGDYLCRCGRVELNVEIAIPPVQDTSDNTSSIVRNIRQIRLRARGEVALSRDEYNRMVVVCDAARRLATCYSLHNLMSGHYWPTLRGQPDVFYDANDALIEAARALDVDALPEVDEDEGDDE